MRKDLTTSEAVAIAIVIKPEVKKETSQYQTAQTVEKLEPPGVNYHPVRKKREISWLGWWA